MRQQVLQAARQLVESGTTATRLRVTDLVAARACTEQQFGELFPDIDSFRRELCSLLFAQAHEAIITATAGLQPGPQQLTTAFIAYLDHNLRHPALQELAHHLMENARGRELLARMEEGVAMIVQADLAAMNASLRPARAQLLTALAVTAVRAEYRAGRALPDVREALVDYCHRSGPG